MNKIKNLFVFLFVMSFSSIAYGQKGGQDSVQKCSAVISRLSYFWSVDSLANNGFRLYTYKSLLNCEIDKLIRSFLLEKLGKPSKVQKTNHGTEYMYYVYDSKAMPPRFGQAFEVWYISFFFGEYDKYLTSISEGVLDY